MFPFGKPSRPITFSLLQERFYTVPRLEVSRAFPIEPLTFFILRDAVILNRVGNLRQLFLRVGFDPAGFRLQILRCSDYTLYRYKLYRFLPLVDIFSQVSNVL